MSTSYLRKSKTRAIEFESPFPFSSLKKKKKRPNNKFLFPYSKSLDSTFLVFFFFFLPCPFYIRTSAFSSIKWVHFPVVVNSHNIIRIFLDRIEFLEIFTSLVLHIKMINELIFSETWAIILLGQIRNPRNPGVIFLHWLE